MLVMIKAELIYHAYMSSAPVSETREHATLHPPLSTDGQT